MNYESSEEIAVKFAEAYHQYRASVGEPELVHSYVGWPGRTKCGAEGISTVEPEEVTCANCMIGKSAVGEPGASEDYETMQAHFEKGCAKIIDKEIGPALDKLPLPARLIAKANMMDILTAIHTAYENGKYAGLKSAVGEGVEGQKDGWISVDERLPEMDGTPYLVNYVKYKPGPSAAPTELDVWTAQGQAAWYNFIKFGGTSGITHWQPLPTPPSTEGEK